MNRGTILPTRPLSRFGGDEFAVLLEVEDQSESMGFAASLLESLPAPIHLGGRQMSVLASIGVAHIGLVDPTPSVDELLAHADMAMYVVKGRGKGDVLLHTPGMQLEEVDDVALGRALAQALADGEITMAFPTHRRPDHRTPVRPEGSVAVGARGTPDFARGLRSRR